MASSPPPIGNTIGSQILNCKLNQTATATVVNENPGSHRQRYGQERTCQVTYRQHSHQCDQQQIHAHAAGECRYPVSSEFATFNVR